MSKPLIEYVGEEKAREVLASVDGSLKGHLDYLIRNLEVELGTSPPSLWFKNKSMFVPGPEVLPDRLERLLWRSGYLVENKLSEEELSKLLMYLTKLASDALFSKGERELVWEGENVRYFIEASDGIVAPIHGFIFRFADELIVSEITYAYVTKLVIDSKGFEREVRAIEPIIAYSKFREGAVTERNYVPPLAFKEKPLIFEVAGRPVRVEVRSVGRTALQTLMTKATLERFRRGEEAKPFPELFGMVKERLMKYVSFKWDPRLYDVVSCYILGTYFYDMFPAYPRMQFIGPFGSGKTRAMLTTVYMSRHGYAILSPTEASNYRSIEAYGPTLGIDEKTFTKEFETLVAAGYKRSGKVPRVTKVAKEKFILELFNVYAPVVFSTVEELSENLKQKTIVITMEISEDPNPEHRDPEPWDLEDIREELYLARLTRAWEVYETMRSLKIPELKLPRAFELWFPLLVMAKLSGEEIYNNVLSYALEDVGERFRELYEEEKKLLQAIEVLFYGEMKEQTTLTEIDPLKFTIEFTATDIHEALKKIMVDVNKELDEKAFMKKWNTVKIGKLLHSRLKLKNKPVSGGRKRIYTLSLEKFLKLCETFGFMLTLVTDVTLTRKTPESAANDTSQIEGTSETMKEETQSFPEQL